LITSGVFHNNNNIITFSSAELTDDSNSYEEKVLYLSKITKDIYIVDKVFTNISAIPVSALV